MLNRTIILFLVLVIYSCSYTDVKSNSENDLALRVSKSNLLLIELVEANLEDSEITRKQLDFFREIAEVKSGNTQQNYSEIFSGLLNDMKVIDQKYFTKRYGSTGAKNKEKIINRFGSYSRNKQSQNLIISLNEFMENLIRKNDLNNIKSNSELFLAVIPKNTIVKSKGVFHTEVVLGQKVKSLKGVLKLNNYARELKLTNGTIDYKQACNSIIKDDYLEEELNFRFETKIDGRDTILRVSQKYIVDN